MGNTTNEGFEDLHANDSRPIGHWLKLEKEELPTAVLLIFSGSSRPHTTQ